MNIIFLSQCGTYEGYLKSFSNINGTAWYLISKEGEYYQFLGNELLQRSYAKYTGHAFVYGHCHVSALGEVKLELLEVKPIFQSEWGIISNSTDEGLDQKQYFEASA